MSKQKLTTASGIPYFHHEDTQSIGQRSPLLLQDYILHEKLAHFNRERIPEFPNSFDNIVPDESHKKPAGFVNVGTF